MFPRNKISFWKAYTCKGLIHSTWQEFRQPWSPSVTLDLSTWQECGSTSTLPLPSWVPWWESSTWSCYSPSSENTEFWMPNTTSTFKTKVGQLSTISKDFLQTYFWIVLVLFEQMTRIGTYGLNFKKRKFYWIQHLQIPMSNNLIRLKLEWLPECIWVFYHSIFHWISFRSRRNPILQTRHFSCYCLQFHLLCSALHLCCLWDVRC